MALRGEATATLPDYFDAVNPEMMQQLK